MNLFSLELQDRTVTQSGAMTGRPAGDAATTRSFAISLEAAMAGRAPMQKGEALPMSGEALPLMSDALSLADEQSGIPATTLPALQTDALPAGDVQPGLALTLPREGLSALDTDLASTLPDEVVSPTLSGELDTLTPGLTSTTASIEGQAVAPAASRGEPGLVTLTPATTGNLRGGAMLARDASPAPLLTSASASGINAPGQAPLSNAFPSGADAATVNPDPEAVVATRRAESAARSAMTLDRRMAVVPDGEVRTAGAGSTAASEIDLPLSSPGDAAASKSEVSKVAVSLSADASAELAPEGTASAVRLAAPAADAPSLRGAESTGRDAPGLSGQDSPGLRDAVIGERKEGGGITASTERGLQLDRGAIDRVTQERADRTALELAANMADRSAADQAAKPSAPNTTISPTHGAMAHPLSGTTTTAPDSVTQLNRPTFQLSTPAGQPGFEAEFASRVRWMVGQDSNVAEIRLSPAHLGSIEIHISTDDDKASVTIFAQNASTRELIEQSMPRLREALAGSGLDLAEGNVSERGPSGRDDGDARGSSHGPGGAADDHDTVQDQPSAPRLTSTATGLVDAFV